MKNRLFLFLFGLIITFLDSPLVARELALKRVSLTNTGNYKVVPAITYLKNIVNILPFKEVQKKLLF